MKGAANAMKTVYIFTAEDLEEVECLTVVDLLRRGGVDCRMVSLTDSLEIRGSHGIRMQADLTYPEADMEKAEALILPGGMPGTLHLGEDRRLAADLLKAKQSGKLLAAICAAPRVLGGLGLLQGERATCHPGHEEYLTGAELTENEVEISGNVITSRGLGTAIPFALAILARLQGPEEAEKVRKAIVFN
jgi:4-methyl-5(b-hydroxyethyl)-thiazole monophosphate biosynthesis